MSELSHIDSQGNAIARGQVKMAADTLQLIARGEHKKGDVLSVARLAGIQAAKQCSQLIPLCHPLMLSSVDVDLQLDEQDSLVTISARCKVNGPTGVEMEALTAVSVAALTIYDMCKAVDKDMLIEGICLVEKSGGRSGHYQRQDQA